VPAAVLVPLIEAHPAGRSLVFILRTSGGPHGGQISFPGGVREEGDGSPEDTALREFEEELGVPRSVVDVIETLPDMLTVTTGYEVTPVLGRLPAGLAWRPDPAEVVDVLEVPLTELVRAENRREMTLHYPSWPEPRTFPCIVTQGHTIWGLTFRILELALPRLAP
jgi:8-oxo-dGTP pyrophosphatase MutT (NUDIX family)